jgi:hypothetical protein
MVITSKRNPDNMEKTFATRFSASVLLVKLPVRNAEKQKEATMFSVEIIMPVILKLVCMLASFTMLSL